MSNTPRHILVISPYFAPEVHPRAHRWTTVCEAWANAGHQVTVICGNVKTEKTYLAPSGMNILRVGHATMRNRLFGLGSGSAAGSTHLTKGILKWLFDQFLRWVRPRFYPDEANRLFVPRARRVAHDLLMREKYDVVITVSKPFSTHLLGTEIKERYPGLYWLADCGDPWIAGMPHAVAASKYAAAAKLEADTLAQADCVSVTHERVAEVFRRAYKLEKLHVVPPVLVDAFNPAQMQPRHDHTQQDAPFIELAYFGALYAPERDATLLLTWAKAIRGAAPELAKRIRIRIFGTIQPSIAMQLALEPMVQFVGQIGKHEVARAMSTTDVLLHLGNSNDFLLPSKLVEYIASNRPILHLGYHDSDACTEFLTAWGQCYRVLVWREGKFAEGDVQKHIPFLLGTDTNRNRPRRDLQDICSPQAVASAYLEVLTR